MKFQDYYETLGVTRDASSEDITKAYRKLARKYHPDINKAKDAEDRFKQIGEAYEVLKDPEKRHRYDSLGANFKAGQDFRPPPEWGDVRFNFNSGGANAFSGFGGGNFSDFFEALFGGGGSSFGGGNPFGAGLSQEDTLGRQRQHRNGESMEVELELGLEEAFQGGTKRISLEVREADEAGRLSRRTKTYQVKVPPGTRDGSVIRLAGQGAKGTRGGSAGDLLLRAKIRPHPLFKVEGRNLSVQVPISPWEASLGAKIEVPLVEGNAVVSVPPGSQSGQRLRLRGKGFPSKEGAGDLYAELRIVVPKQVSGEERELWQRLQSVSKFNPRSAGLES